MTLPVANASLLRSLVSDILDEVKMDETASVSKIGHYTESLVKGMQMAQYEAQRTRMSQVLGHEVTCLPIDDGDKVKKFPLLASFGVPLSKEFVSPILREIVLLSECFPEEDLLTFTTHRGTHVQLVTIPASKNRYRFRRNLRRQPGGKKSWLQTLAESVSVTEDDEDDGSTGAGWILESLGREFEDQFVATARELGYPVTTKKMPAESAAEMWQEANISKKAQRVVLRHLGAHFGSRLVVPEVEVAALGQNHVPPNCSTFIHNRQTIHFWTKPLTDSLCRALEANLEGVANSCQVPDSIDIVVGGDHGKGRFRAVCKAILRKDGKRFNSFVFKIANIDCPKDTYGILRDSIATPLNDGLKSLMTGGTIQFYRVGDNCKVCIGPTVLSEREATLDASIPVRCFVAGDLAFYTAVLGKVNMSGRWCIWCKLNSTEWKESGHDEGEPWSLLQLTNMKEQIDAGLVREGDAQARKGVTDNMLFDTVDIDHYVISLLHVEIGVGNKVLESYFDWVDCRIEELSDEERRARLEFFEADRDLEQHKVNWEEWMDGFGPRLAHLREQRKMLADLIKMRGNGNQYLHSLEERNEMKEESKELTKAIANLGKEKKEQYSLVTTANQIRSLKKKNMGDMRKQRGRDSNVRGRLEEAMRRHGIVRSAYHGGALTGTHIALLFQRGMAIFDEFGEILLSATGHQCGRDEILDMTRRYKELCTLLDYLFSVARTPCGEASDEVCDLAEEIVQKVMVKWRDLRLSMLLPKIDAVEDHLVKAMKRFKGIGCFIEDFIEQAHQFGHQDETRTKGMPDRSRAALSHSAWEVSTWKAGVVKVKEEVRRKTKRKRMAVGSLAGERIENRKMKRMDLRKDCLQKATLVPSPIADYTRTARDEYLEEDNAQ